MNAASEKEPALNIAVAGAGGRMGRSLIQALTQTPAMCLSGALLASGDEREGQDAGEIAGVGSTGVTATTDPLDAIAGADVVIDFSLPTGTMALLDACQSRSLPLVCGVTGLDSAQQQRLQAAGRQIPVLYAANMSVGVNLMICLSEIAARTLAACDAEISEVHHRHKRDAPSGTALAIGAAINQGRGVESPSEIGRGPGDGPRTAGAVGYASLRAGDIVGEHTLMLAGEGERLEITHRASDRIAFASGALRAARWLVGQSAGYFGMAAVLGLDDRPSG
ncbi:MAG: 4-hydroxy-tetrahydrodipicolinate reductase [Gammaproteobacteria bacterium]